MMASKLNHLVGGILISLWAVASESFSAPLTTWDQSLYSGYRSYPLGLSLGSDLGFNASLWSMDEPGKPGSWRYGYIRSGVSLRTSGLVSSGEVKLSVAPLSILQLVARQTWTHRQVDAQGLRCDLDVLCRGRLDRRGFAVEHVGALGSLVWSLEARWDQIMDPSKDASRIGDHITNLEGASNSDWVHSLFGLVGLKWASSWMTGLVQGQDYVRGSRQLGGFVGGLMRYQWGSDRQYAANFLLSRYGSTLLEKNWSGALGLSWNINPSLAPR